MIFIVLSYFVFLEKAEIINIQNWCVSLQSVKLSDHINVTGIFTSQISVTLIVVTLSSMVANLEKKYIYGERAIELVFSKKGFFSYKVFVFTLFSLLFANLFVLIKNTSESLIVTLFLASIIIITLFVYRFARLFFGTIGIKKRLLFSYYHDNLRHLKKARPLNSKTSKRTEKFKNITIKYIRENDFPNYNEHLNVYFALLEMCLFNNKNIIQEYYTESITHNDLIAHLKTFSYQLLQSGKQQEGIDVYKKLINMLNYFQVVLVHDINSYNINDFIEQSKYIRTESELKKYGDSVFNLVSGLFYQVYLYSFVDLSYCRLYEHKMIHSYFYSDLLERYYTSIYENGNLNQIDKNRVYEKFFDNLRMTTFNEDHPETTINDFLENKMLHKEPDIYPVEIKAEPIALMILKMIENNDADNVKMFLNMNVSNKLINAIKVLTIFSVTEMAFRNNKKVFMLDLDIDISSAYQMLQKSRVSNWNYGYAEMIDLYKTIIEKYTSKDTSEYTDGSFYGFHPRLKFSCEVVDTFFMDFFEKVDSLEQFKSDTDNEGIIKNETVVLLLSNLSDNK